MMADPSSNAGLRQGVGLATAAALMIGNTVGVGIFLTPVGMARGGIPAYFVFRKR
jgi:hypothetical protein